MHDGNKKVSNLIYGRTFGNLLHRFIKMHTRITISFPLANEVYLKWLDVSAKIRPTHTQKLCVVSKRVTYAANAHDFITRSGISIMSSNFFSLPFYFLSRKKAINYFSLYRYNMYEKSKFSISFSTNKSRHFYGMKLERAYENHMKINGKHFCVVHEHILGASNRR